MNAFVTPHEGAALAAAAQNGSTFSLESAPILAGFSYSIPTIGQIKIGHMDWSEGDRGRPQKDPFITVASQVKGDNGLWNLHPINKELSENAELKNQVRRDSAGNITGLPVRFKFNDLRLLFQERYEAFDIKTKRQLCSSSGIGQPFSCTVGYSAENRVCPGPANCAYGTQNRCSLFGRLRVQIPGQEAIDTMGSFIFRTRGFNSVNALRMKMTYFHALTGGHLAGLKLMLKICACTKPQSHGSPIYYLDLVLPTGVSEFEAVKEAKKHKDEEAAAGFPRAEIEASMWRLVSNGHFRESDEDAEQLEDLITDEGEGEPPGEQATAGDIVVGAPGPAPLKSIAGGRTAPGESVGLGHLRAVINEMEDATGGKDGARPAGADAPAPGVESAGPSAAVPGTADRVASSCSAVL